MGHHDLIRDDLRVRQDALDRPRKVAREVDGQVRGVERAEVGFFVRQLRERRLERRRHEVFVDAFGQGLGHAPRGYGE